MGCGESVSLIHETNQKIAQGANQEGVALLHGPAEWRVDVRDRYEEYCLCLPPKRLGPLRVGEIDHQCSFIGILHKSVTHTFHHRLKSGSEPIYAFLVLRSVKREIHAQSPSGPPGKGPSEKNPPMKGTEDPGRLTILRSRSEPWNLHVNR